MITNGPHSATFLLKMEENKCQYSKCQSVGCRFTIVHKSILLYKYHTKKWQYFPGSQWKC